MAAHGAAYGAAFRAQGSCWASGRLAARPVVRIAAVMICIPDGCCTRAGGWRGDSGSLCFASATSSLLFIPPRPCPFCSLSRAIILEQDAPQVDAGTGTQGRGRGSGVGGDNGHKDLAAARVGLVWLLCFDFHAVLRHTDRDSAEWNCLAMLWIARYLLSVDAERPLVGAGGRASLRGGGAWCVGLGEDGGWQLIN